MAAVANYPKSGKTVDYSQNELTHKVMALINQSNDEVEFEEILNKLRPQYRDTELREVIWKLIADRLIILTDDLKLHK
jgi:hypothetical protein